MSVQNICLIAFVLVCLQISTPQKPVLWSSIYITLSYDEQLIDICINIERVLGGGRHFVSNIIYSTIAVFSNNLMSSATP